MKFCRDCEILLFGMVWYGLVWFALIVLWSEGSQSTTMSLRQYGPVQAMHKRKLHCLPLYQQTSWRPTLRTPYSKAKFESLTNLMTNFETLVENAKFPQCNPRR